MSDRKYIPVSIKRALLEETVYRCASCLCSMEHCEDDDTFFRFDEKAHITPHNETQDDSFENLITLCPTCHAKVDKNKDKLERLKSLKRQWLGISGKYSKLEVDCLLALYKRYDTKDYLNFIYEKHTLISYNQTISGTDFEPILNFNSSNPHNTYSVPSLKISPSLHWMFYRLNEDELICFILTDKIIRDANSMRIDNENCNICLTKKGYEFFKKLYE
jgi:hypothetical protein